MMGYLTSLYLNSPYSAAFEKDVPHLKLAVAASKLASLTTLTLKDFLKAKSLISAYLMVM